MMTPNALLTSSLSSAARHFALSGPHPHCCLTFIAFPEWTLFVIL
jgi:hypothetical protein